MTTQQKKLRTLLGIVAIFFFQLVALGVVGAKEAEYPGKPIQFLVGLPSGSMTNLSARALAKVATKYVGKPLVVVDMPGAASAVAMNELAKLPPDGYTIGFIPTSFMSIVTHMEKVPFDKKLLKPLLGFYKFPQFLIVSGESPFTKIEDLIASVRKNPNLFTWGHSGRGTEPHIQGVLFFKSRNVDATDLPFKGSSESQQALLGGHIQARLGSIAGATVSLMRAGKVRALLVFNDRRVAEAPEVPTSIEKGYGDFNAFNPVMGVLIHRDTPADRFKKLHDALEKTIEDPEFNKIMGDMGLTSEYFSPKAFEEASKKLENAAVPVLKELKLFVE